MPITSDSALKVSWNVNEKVIECCSETFDDLFIYLPAANISSGFVHVAF